jgi:small subunit ribosomal protein S1
MKDEKRMTGKNDAPIKRFIDTDEDLEQGAQGEFAEMFHDSLKQLQTGEIVKGIVVKVNR